MDFIDLSFGSWLYFIDLLGLSDLFAGTATTSNINGGPIGCKQ